MELDSSLRYLVVFWHSEESIENPRRLTGLPYGRCRPRIVLQESDGYFAQPCCRHNVAC